MDSDSARNTDNVASGQATRFNLLRHGITIWNEQKRVQGLEDSPLTSAGIEQTKIWAEHCARLHFHRIVASDLGRVQQTVSILNEKIHLPVIFDKRLREQNWGSWEGLTVAEVYQKHSSYLEKEVAKGWHFTPPDGESRMEVKNRVLLAFNDTTIAFPGENILVVCHLGVIKCLLYALANRSFLPAESKLIEKNRMHCITSHRGTYHIAELNIRPLANG